MWLHAKTAGHEIHGQSGVYEEETGKNIAIVYDGKAHAAVLAAAPELLEALAGLLFHATEGELAQYLEINPESLHCVKTARAAIAKAEGNS